MVWNGRIGSLTGGNVLKARTGEKVRFFVGNAGLNLVSSFHIIGDHLERVFDEGSLDSPPLLNIQNHVIPAGAAAVVETVFEVPGDYPPDAPVVFVTWEDASAYCEAAERRLPTEAGWEYAAAGGLEPSRGFSPAEKSELAWYGGARKAPRPVGKGLASAQGIHDLHGNVWEWVSDLGGRYSGRDPRNPGDRRDNLGCGQFAGDTGSYAYYLRAAVRSAAEPDTRTPYRGFRCAR